MIITGSIPTGCNPAGQAFPVAFRPREGPVFSSRPDRKGPWPCPKWLCLSQMGGCTRRGDIHRNGHRTDWLADHQDIADPVTHQHLIAVTGPETRQGLAPREGIRRRLGGKISWIEIQQRPIRRSRQSGSGPAASNQGRGGPEQRRPARLSFLGSGRERAGTVQRCDDEDVALQLSAGKQTFPFGKGCPHLGQMTVFPPQVRFWLVLMRKRMAPGTIGADPEHPVPGTRVPVAQNAG